MSAALNDKSPVPWYKQGWPWFLIALPASAVVAGVITLVIAVKTWDGLVVDDYYKEGRTIVKTIGRTEHAKKLGLSAKLNIRTDALRIEITDTDGKDIPQQVLVSITHPTREGADQHLVLSGHEGVFEGAMVPLATGRWLFQIEDESRSWRLNGAAYLPTETEVRIDPSDS